MHLRRIKGLWAAVDKRSGEIVECFDTKAEALDFVESWMRVEGLKEFDRSRRWISMYDVEHGMTA